MAGRKVQAMVEAMLRDFNTALRVRDPDIASLFHNTALFIGSEPGEMARGRDAIAALFVSILASPASVQFDWSTIETARSGDTAWFFADGAVVIDSAAGRTRRPYGLTGVLVKGRKGWRWRLFHGSEPWIDSAAHTSTPETT
jgi:uncharacterized protein (TIGR02246 family)